MLNAHNKYIRLSQSSTLMSSHAHLPFAGLLRRMNAVEEILDDQKVLRKHNDFGPVQQETFAAEVLAGVLTKVCYCGRV